MSHKTKFKTASLALLAVITGTAITWIIHAQPALVTTDHAGQPPTIPQRATQQNSESVTLRDYTQPLARTLNALTNIQASIDMLEKRLTSVERELDAVRLDVGHKVGRDYYEAEKEKRRGNERDEPFLQQRQATARRRAYFHNLDRSIVDNADPLLSQEINAIYTSILASGEEWAQDAELVSSECGGDFCKVVINHPNDMPPMAQLTLDAEILLQVMDEFPRSISKSQTKPDGSTNLIVYFAKKGANMPRMN